MTHYRPSESERGGVEGGERERGERETYRHTYRPKDK